MSKTVLITGTSSGIGRETALIFQKMGWNVAATQRDLEKESELTQLDHTVVLKLDVTNPQTIREAIQKTTKEFGKIDVLVNNAGYGQIGPFEATSEEETLKEFNVNVFGGMRVIKEILPEFRKRKEGIIINVASFGGRITFPLYSIYHSTKWAVEGFSESLQHELRQFNIKVKIIEPGVINTPFYDHVKIAAKKGLEDYDKYAIPSLRKMQEAGRNGSSPKGVAKTIFEAANSDNWQLRYPTGKNAKLTLFLRRFLPDRLFTYLIRKNGEG